MSQVRNLPPEQTTSSNLHALLSLLALKNASGTEYSNLFSPAEIQLINHIIDTAIDSQPNFGKWIFEKFLNKTLPFSSQRFFLDTTFSPAYVQQVLARKYLIKLKVEHSIKHQQVEQIVFLGSDYDPQAFNISKKYPIKVFELASDIISEIKLKAFLSLTDGFSTQYNDFHYQPSHTCINGNYHLIKCNFLSINLKKALINCAFDPEKETLFIIEEFTKHLSSVSNLELLTRLFHLSKPNNEILISYRSNLNNQMLESALQYAIQDNYQFAIEPEKVIDFAAEKGFCVIGKMLHQDLLNWMGTNIALSKNPALGFENYYLLRKTPGLTKDRIDISQVPSITEDFGALNLLVNKRGCTII